MRCAALSLPSCSAARVAGCLRKPVRVSSAISARGLRVVPFASKTSGNSSDVDEGNVGDFCSLDEMGRRMKSKMTVGEMEQEFLAALSSWYFEGKPKMSDAEFENLKDELLWNGSQVAVLDSDELMFLEASQAFAKGKPIMADDDFEALKVELKKKGSVVAAEGPRCSIRSKKMYADCKPDYLRMLVLNVPAALLVLGVVFGIDDVTGFEITKAIELPPPYGVALLWGLLLPTTFVLASSITNLAFKDSIILKGPCPNCGAENFTYFGDVLSVAGNRGQNTMDCSKCGAGLTFDEYKRIIAVSETVEDKQRKAAELAAKRAAVSGRK